MPYEDPFSSAPAEEAQQAPVAEAPAQAPASPARPAAATGEGKVVVTLKGGRDFDAPWIVVHADSVNDALAQVNTKAMAELMKVAQNAAKAFSGSAPVSQNAPASGGGQQSRAPQQAQEAPGGEKRFCQHGEMVYKTGVAKSTGKPYALFSCTAPRDQQCKAQWPDKK